MTFYKWKRATIAGMALIAGAALMAFALLTTDRWPLVSFLLTPDQSGHRYLQRGEYEQAEMNFSDPMWKGVAWFEQGEFKKAAGIFRGIDTAEAAFNHGNALVMQGRYEEAVNRYDRALELKPGWEDAAANRKIAQGRAAMLEKKGGDMTGGKLEADEIVFSEGKPPSSSGEEQSGSGQQMSDTELRAMWLRNVQTKPADFLRVKFAYQHAKGKNAP